MRKIVVSFFGSGRLRPFPGTWGTAAALIVYAALYFGLVGGLDLGWASFNLLVLLLIVAAMIAGIALGPWAEREYQQKDPSNFVLDEAAGFWISMLFLPVSASTTTVAGAAALQFVLFRIADIIKPTPARQSQALAHGWGIMIDDVIAGIYCNIVAQILFRTVWG